MLGIIEEIDHQGLYELRQRHDSGRITLSKLSKELDRISSEIKVKTGLLKSLNTEYAVTERRIKESQNEAFLIRKKCSGIIDDGYLLLHEEFERRENQLADLKSQKTNLSNSIANIEKESRKISRPLRILEKERQELFKSFQERDAVKQAISDEISEALSKTSLDREEIEPRLMELNTAALDHMDKRRDIQMRLSEKEDAIKGLVDSLFYLKHQIESLEQLKALQGEMNSLKEVIKELQLVNESLPSKPGDLAKDLNDKQERFDALAKKNEDHRKEIESLEKEISEYDETVTRRNTAQEERDSTFQRNEQGLEELMELFIHKTELETSALMMREKIEAIAELVESMG
jgi:chromosome segregation ATPase